MGVIPTCLSFICFPAVLRGPVRCWRTAGAVCMTVNLLSVRLSEVQVKYILNDHSCGSAQKVNTVRSWLDKFGIPEHDDFFLLWNKVLMSLSRAIMRLEEAKVPKSALDLLWDAIFQILYLQYDINQELMPQFRAAADTLLRLSEKIMKDQLPIKPTDNTDCISGKKKS